MAMSTPQQQAGFTFGGFVVGLFILVILVLFGFKLIPAYMENAEIQSMLVAVAHDPNMQNATAHELRGSFDRHAAVNWVSGVKSEDIEIEKDEAGRPILSASYEVRIKLAGNVSLLLNFNPTSAGK